TNTFSSSVAACAPVSTVLNACVACSPQGIGTPSATSATNPSPAEPQYACTNPGGTWTCGYRPIASPPSSDRLEVTPTPLSPDPNSDLGYYNRLLAVNVFDNNATPRSIFTNSATAATYDSRSLSETGLTNLFAGTFSPTVPPRLDAQSNGSAA